tara:strand:- start:93 stop:392 length:300 start_codon:yes stop_codon:yes gene_type:complete
MKTENKNYRIIVLLTGLVFYYIFFATFWSSTFSYLKEFDFFNSLIGQLIQDIIFAKLLGWHDYNLEWLIIIIFNVFYLYFLWKFREEIVVLIKKLINKI